MYKEIIVPLDGSELAEKALPHATELARVFGARLTIITVIEPFVPYPSEVDRYGGLWTTTENLKIEEEEWLAGVQRTKELLEKIAAPLRTEGIDARIKVLEGDPASAICDYTHKSHADLIVMSTHGRTGLQRWVYGSVADKVLKGASVPVLLVRVLQVPADEHPKGRQADV